MENWVKTRKRVSSPVIAGRRFEQVAVGEQCQWRRGCEKERVEGQDEGKKLKADDLLFLTTTTAARDQKEKGRVERTHSFLSSESSFASVDRYLFRLLNSLPFTTSSSMSRRFRPKGRDAPY